MGPPALAAAPCAGASATPLHHGTPAVRRALRCALNHERRRRGLPRLDPVRAIRLAASRHAADMARRGYFAHVTPEGRTLRARLADVGYRRPAGEILAWGCAELSTVADTVARWLRSDGHRRLLLSRAYRRLGIGVAPSAPGGHCAAPPGATYVVDLG